MPIRHRDHTHETVAEVRECHFPPEQTRVAGTLRVGRPLPGGDYTVELNDDEYRTLRISQQPKDAEFKPGHWLISYLSGPDNERSYISFGHFVHGMAELRIWRRFQNNEVLIAAAKALINASDDERDAMHSGRCARCGRKLTVPASKSMGLGPTCAGKV